ncbi:RNA polymerase sigma factor [Ekhidna sp.]|uniref:RNA polymerase sigma factor n=1 Tax=Ekhidna sp. TaxID=2608089 RepID=UPI0032998E78
MSATSQLSFQSIFDQYQPMVAQMCLGFVSGDQDVASDLTQEVFINTWNAMEKFEGRSSYKTWIYRITINTCLQYHRKKKRDTHVSIGSLESDVADSNNTTDEERSSELYRAINQLGKVDRLIIMMVLDELEYEEIAEVMGISESNLRVKIHRIKKRLKKLMHYE